MVHINRGRDVLQLIKTKGERGVHEALVKIAEDNTILHQEIAELKKVIMQTTRLLTMFQDVAEGQQKALAQMAQKFDPNNEANPNQSWSGKS